jgi:hypothetical protein
MVRLITDFVYSRVCRHAATLQSEARLKYLRQLAIVYGLWVALCSVLAFISLALAIYTFTSKVGIGQVVFFLICCFGFVVLVCCFFRLFRRVSRES